MRNSIDSITIVSDDSVLNDISIEENVNAIDEIDVIDSKNNIIMPVSYKKALQRVLSTAIPIVGFRLSALVGSFAGSLMLARVDTETLAASALINSSQFAILTLSTATLNAVTIVTGKNFGARETIKLGKILQQGWLLSAGLSVIPMVAFASLSPFLHAIRQPATSVAIVESFAHAYLLNFPARMGLVASQQFALGLKDTKTVLGIGLLSTGILTASSYALIFGKLGAPALGAAGFGYATAIEAWLTLAAYQLLFRFNKRYQPYQIYDWQLRKNLTLLRELWSNGWPIIIASSGELTTTFVSAIMAGYLGKASLSAQNIASQYVSITLAPLLALFQTNSILVSQSLGKKENHNLKRLAYTSVGLSIGYSLAVFTLFCATPKPLISLFVSEENKDVTDVLKPALYLTMGGQVFDATRRTLNGALYGARDAKILTAINMIAQWLIGITLCYVLTFPGELGVSGIALGNGLAIAVCALMLFLRWNQKSNQLAARENISDTHSLSYNNTSFFYQKKQNINLTDAHLPNSTLNNASSRALPFGSFFKAKVAKYICNTETNSRNSSAPTP